jgi:hypothetical protein
LSKILQFSDDLPFESIPDLEFEQNSIASCHPNNPQRHAANIQLPDFDEDLFIAPNLPLELGVSELFQNRIQPQGERPLKTSRKYVLLKRKIRVRNTLGCTVCPFSAKYVI